MRILFISKDNPFGLGGGNFATRAYLQAFLELCNGNIDVFLADSIHEDNNINVHAYYKTPERSFFKRVYSVLSGNELSRYPDAVKRHLSRNAKYDLCVFNNSKVAAGLIEFVGGKGVRTVTIHHNVEPEYVRDNTPNPLLRALLVHHVRCAERNSFFLSDYNLFLTKQDLDIFLTLYGDNNKTNRVLGTFEFKDLPSLTPKEFNNKDVTIAVTGSLCTVQGVDGIKFFFDELYPCLPFNVGVIISGREPTDEIIRLCETHERVKLVPNPEDMNSIINQADIYVCPTRLGGGLKLRVMDGLRLGIPVISHTCSARGYDAFDGSTFFQSFSDKNSFKEALSRILQNYESGLISRERIRKQYASVFSYDAGLSRLKGIIME